MDDPESDLLLVVTDSILQREVYFFGAKDNLGVSTGITSIESYNLQDSGKLLESMTVDSAGAWMEWYVVDEFHFISQRLNDTSYLNTATDEQSGESYVWEVKRKPSTGHQEGKFLETVPNIEEYSDNLESRAIEGVVKLLCPGGALISSLRPYGVYFPSELSPEGLPLPLSRLRFKKTSRGAWQYRAFTRVPGSFTRLTCEQTQQVSLNIGFVMGTALIGELLAGAMMGEAALLNAGLSAELVGKIRKYVEGAGVLMSMLTTYACDENDPSHSWYREKFGGGMRSQSGKILLFCKPRKSPFVYYRERDVAFPNSVNNNVDWYFPEFGETGSLEFGQILLSQPGGQFTFKNMVTGDINCVEGATSTRLIGNLVTKRGEVLLDEFTTGLSPFAISLYSYLPCIESEILLKSVYSVGGQSASRTYHINVPVLDMSKWTQFDIDVESKAPTNRSNCSFQGSLVNGRSVTFGGLQYWRDSQAEQEHSDGVYAIVPNPRAGMDYATVSCGESDGGITLHSSVEAREGKIFVDSVDVNNYASVWFSGRTQIQLSLTFAPIPLENKDYSGTLNVSFTPDPVDQNAEYKPESKSVSIPVRARVQMTRR